MTETKSHNVPRTHQRCRSCGVTMAINRENFMAVSGRGHEVGRTCKDCIEVFLKELRKDRPRAQRI